ncbi:hypothetical protein DL98DRAFT_585023 [Cadophora sp. DSE1049]|nr:hypothetical protein DL98DRAFT_585023 [Cadophora sp. DSE1049]
MHSLELLLPLFLTSIVQYAVALSRPSVATEGAFNAAWIDAPGRITRFESTMIVPALPRNGSSSQALRSVWAGIQPMGAAGILQNVLMNQNTGVNNTTPNTWYFLPEWCCKPSKDLVPLRIRQFPDDTITSLFQWNSSEVKPSGGGIMINGEFDTAYDSNGRPPMALLAIQTPRPASWDFGVVNWKNVIIEAETTTTDWCTSVPNGNSQFNWSKSAPVVTVDQERNITTCYFANFKFLGEGNDD